jgi:hypothetical protein
MSSKFRTNGIDRHPIGGKRLERMRSGVVEDSVDGFRDVLQAQVGVSRGDTHDLAQNLLPKLRLQGIARDQPNDGPWNSAGHSFGHT